MLMQSNLYTLGLKAYMHEFEIYNVTISIIYILLLEWNFTSNH